MSRRTRIRLLVEGKRCGCGHHGPDRPAAAGFAEWFFYGNKPWSQITARIFGDRESVYFCRECESCVLDRVKGTAVTGPGLSFQKVVLFPKEART